MSRNFYPLRIRQVTRETKDCVSVSFDVPEQLHDAFQFKQGQYLTLKTRLLGEEVRRSYSICSSPLDKDWKVAIKKVSGGMFSSFANEGLKVGDLVEVMPPDGRFYTELDPLHIKQYMAFAAGSGITPLLSIIETTLRVEQSSSFTLVFGNRYRNEIIFKEALERLKNRFMERFRMLHVLSREKTDAPINYGRIDAEKCKAIFDKLADPQSIDDFFLCGPEEMIFSVKDYLLSIGIEPKKIHFELFTTKSARKPLNKIIGMVDISEESRVVIRKDGLESSFLLSFEGESILDAALHEGADLPYACKGGVCCTCKARLVDGEVTMEVNYGL